MRAGAAGDDHVRVLGAELVSVLEAALQRREAERVERHRVGSTTECHCSGCGVDVVDREGSQLADRRAVQQREQPDERLVRVTVSARPAAQQPRLVGSGKGAAAEAAGRSVGETCARVGETDPLVAGEAKEVAQRREPEPAITIGRQETLEMSARARRPVVEVLLFEVDGKLGEDREALLDRVVFERSLADPTGALATGQQRCRVSLGRGAQRRRAALDPPLASAVSESAALVAGEHQAAGDEKRFQQPGCVSRAATGAPAVRDRGDQR